MKRILICFFLPLIFCSCSIIDSSRKSAGISRQQLFTGDQPTLFWSHYDASQRGGIYLVTKDGSVKVISENPPDAALNSTIDLLVKANVSSEIDATAKFNAIKSITELGKRNASNYMIRDLAFRIESLSNNSGTIDPEILKIYEKLIESSERITISESNQTVANSKMESIKALKELAQMAGEEKYQSLKLDSVFFQRISNYLKDQ